MLDDEQRAALDPILRAKDPWCPLTDLDRAGHGAAIAGLIDAGIVERWGGSPPDAEAVVTLTPFGAWSLGVILVEYREQCPVWYRARKDEKGEVILPDWPIRLAPFAREDRLGGLRSFDLVDPSPTPDYLADDEGRPVLFRGRPIPIDRRMGRQAPKAKKGRKARRTP